MLAGLRGREIGMFFAARSRAKKERQEIEMVCEEFYIILFYYELLCLQFQVNTCIKEHIFKKITRCQKQVIV